MSLGEFDIIARYFTRRSRRAEVLLGIGDDAAVLDVRADRKLVVAMDTLVEGVHFPKGIDASDIGYRALAVNLSDIAAMGAEPAWMTLSLSMPQADASWLAGFAAGLFDLADRYDVALVGGDTVRGPCLITVQLAGWIETDRWLTRSGARPGDLLFISGIPGEAAAGLAVVQGQVPGEPTAGLPLAEGGISGEAAAHLRQRFLRPEPRVALGRELRTLASAAMDVSDGLLTDLQKLCAASGCGAQLDIDALPESLAMRQSFDADAWVQYALAGGDDYEILFAIAPERVHELTRRPDPRPNVTHIGVMTAGSGVQCIRNGQPFVMQRGGYEHFAAAAPPA